MFSVHTALENLKTLQPPAILELCFSFPSRHSNNEKPEFSNSSDLRSCFREISVDGRPDHGKKADLKFQRRSADKIQTSRIVMAAVMTV